MTHHPTINTTRIAAQSHFRTLRLGTPFQPRIAALAQTQDWYNWAGYRAPHSLWDEELEYFAIRSQAALFDISPMTKYRIEGPDAEALLNRVTLRDVTKLKPGRVHYTAWCDDEGFVLDDGTLFRLSPTRFRLCSQERHLPWLLDSAVGFDVLVEEETEAVAGLALQGPTSFAVLRDAGFAGVEKLKIFDLADFPHDGGPQGNTQVTISRTGFTGDLGYELFVPAGKALSLWDRLMTSGELRGIRAIGYTAHARRDRARLHDRPGKGSFQWPPCHPRGESETQIALCAGRTGDRRQHSGRTRHRLPQESPGGRPGQRRHVVADGQAQHRYRFA